MHVGRNMHVGRYLLLATNITMYFKYNYRYIVCFSIAK